MSKTKTKSKSLENLQKALSMELTATHQYLLHAHLLDDWGLDKLAEKMRGEVQEELGHASEFINRILFLKGDPVVTEEKPAKRAKSLKQMFEADLLEEREAIRFYTQAVLDATAEGDIGTRKLFEQIVLDEEGHAAWLELQLELLERMGEQNFVAKYHSGAAAS